MFSFTSGGGVHCFVASVISSLPEPNAESFAQLVDSSEVLLLFLGGYRRFAWVL